MSEREAFEAWAKQPPMEWDCERYTENEAWPGDYRNYPTQCAWDGWQAARAQPAQAVPDPRQVIEMCAKALAEELAAWDIDPPLHHVKEASDACEAWLAAQGAKT